MSINSPEYQNLTDDDIFLWHYSKNAKNQLESLANGYDVDDNKLSGSEINRKYTVEILEEKAKKFKDLKIDEQKEFLYYGVTGIKKKAAKDIEDSPLHSFIIVSARFYLKELEKINKEGDWVKRSVKFSVFVKLPLEEKQKYHNALVAFHDQCKGNEGQSLPAKVLASSPTLPVGGCPDFSDTSKWKKEI